ncbi:hypothetical protein FAM22021_001018 [Propionibacterium freudenreichii]|nr:hypothetical protein [Propionibacterium freudenreichii]
MDTPDLALQPDGPAAVSVPVGVDGDGLPVGVQVVARHGHDEDALAVRGAGWSGRWQAWACRSPTAGGATASKCGLDGPRALSGAIFASRPHFDVRVPPTPAHNHCLHRMTDTPMGYNVDAWAPETSTITSTTAQPGPQHDHTRHAGHAGHDMSGMDMGTMGSMPGWPRCPGWTTTWRTWATAGTPPIVVFLILPPLFSFLSPTRFPQPACLWTMISG